MKQLTRETPLTRPVRVLQFGEGNFLRAFVDWMVDRMNKAGVFDSAVQIVQPLPQGMCDVINAQGGLYHVILRGVKDGQVVEQIERIDCVKGCLNPATQWDQVVEAALNPDLRFVFSNTTEAGIEYRPDADTFPSKVAKLVTARAKAGLGGLIFIPCELIEHNGQKLRECVLKYLTDPEVIRYVEDKCIFCSTLVDRIVAGYPRTDAAKYCEKLGIEDKLLDCGEPFFFFVIEGPAEVEKELPAKAAGLNVLFTGDQTPYRTRKVRFLNGAHTASVLGAHMAGFTFVDEMVRDDVLERFANPYAQHRLLSIALNSVSKWKVRVLPTLLDYLKLTGKLPACLTQSMAYLIDFYRSCEINDAPEVKAFFASKPDVKTILGKTDFWGMDLNTIPGFTAAVERGVTKQP